MAGRRPLGAFACEQVERDVFHEFAFCRTRSSKKLLQNASSNCSTSIVLASSVSTQLRRFRCINPIEADFLTVKVDGIAVDDRNTQRREPSGVILEIEIATVRVATEFLERLGLPRTESIEGSFHWPLEVVSAYRFRPSPRPSFRRRLP